MKSFTKQQYSAQAIKQLVENNNLASPTNITLLNDGEYNTAYRFVSNNVKYVIKIAPTRQTNILSYETEIMRVDYEVCKLISAKTDVITPQIVAFDDTNTIIDTTYMIYKYIDATPLNKLTPLGKNLEKVNFQLGATLAKIHTIVGEQYGYMQLGLQDTWYFAYINMMNAIIDDATRLDVIILQLPKIQQLMADIRPYLQDIKPTLVHFDLWAGNIFVDKQSNIVAITDCERALWGDYIADFVNVNPFGLPNKSCLDGYNSVAATPIIFDSATKIRFYAMRLYLGLITLVEKHLRYNKLSLAYAVKTVFGNTVVADSIKNLETLLADFSIAR